jgi:hypothetical protein
MAAPLGVLPVSLTATTTEVEDVINGGPPGGAASESDCDHH